MKRGGDRGVVLAAVVTVVTALGVQLAFAPASAGRPTLFLALGVPYAVFSALALARLRSAGPAARGRGAPAAGPDADPASGRGAGAEGGASGPPGLPPMRLGLRSGDLSFGFGIALALGALSALGRQVIAPPGSGAELWVVRVYLQFGNLPREKGAYVATAAAVVAVALLEELTWRGLVQPALEGRFGARRAWVLGALLFAAAHLPTVWRLEAPGAGSNPLVVLAALGCGLVWGFCAGRLRRLGPSLASHALYTYGLTMAFRLWP
ncbi:MAG TPA: CPBP family intramembrane glutamic endopeptidase [Polyangiaceae bacterium]|nr:CPBP family intramembrane glutamic endopeptidase [Polyangiaceae bacterium]